MKRPAHHWLLGSVLLLLLVLIGMAIGFGGGVPRQRIVLEDGQVLELQEVTYGTRHQWTPRAWLEKMLGPLAPRSQTAAYLTNFYVSGTPRPHLVFWFTGPPSIPKGSPAPRHVMVADENGREYGNASGLYEWRPGSPRVEYFQAPLPRTGATVTLRFYNSSGTSFASITARNPAAGTRPPSYTPYVQGNAGLAPPPPTPGAPAFPVTAQAREVSVTMLEMTTGLSAGGHGHSRPEVLLSARPTAALAGEMPWTRARFRIDRGAGDWIPLTMTVRDVDDNVAPQSYSMPKGATVWSALPGWIALDGGPVSARLLLQRKSVDRYAPEQCWVLRDVAVPGDGKENVLGQKRTVQGVHLELFALAARGTPTGPGRRDLEKSPYLRLRATRLPEDDRLLTVWATAPGGRVYHADLRDYGVGRSPYAYRIRMPIPRGTRVVDLHFAVHPRREVRTLDFNVSPGRPDSGGGQK